jgi:serralysin
MPPLASGEPDDRPRSKYGARFYPQDPAYGSQQGIGTFNLLSGGFTREASLEQGGYSYAVVLHEFGHAHGLAHPHDTGGGSDIMLGVAGSSSLGIYDLNQGVYTVMSYNDGWETNPDGPQAFTLATIGYGWSGSLSAFDIAQLQERYGVHEYATGDDTYVIRDENAPGTFFSTIWDTGGTDEIVYAGNADARIDLLAATLDYTATGGGVVSFAQGIYGGFTIANGVVIENASGGSGNDVLIGTRSRTSSTAVPATMC